MSQPRRITPWALAAGTLAVLGLGALYVNRKTARAEAANPPRGRFIEVRGVRLHYTEHGDPQAPALVCLHGIGTMGQELELSGLVARAATQYRVLVFDRPGYGHSSRPAGQPYTPAAQAGLFLEALSELGVDRPVVLAHSWGTMVAIAMADRAPEALKGLVLLGGYYTPALRLDVLFNSLPALPGIGRLLAHTVSPLISRLIWQAMLWRVFSPAPKVVRQAFDAEYPKWMTLRPSSLRAAASECAMLIPQAIGLRAKESRLQLPVVIVAGEQDRLVMPRWHSGRLQSRVPNSRLHMVPGAGHMVHHAAPQAVFDAIREVSSLVTPTTPVDLAAPARIAPEDVALEQATG